MTEFLIALLLDPWQRPTRSQEFGRLSNSESLSSSSDVTPRRSSTSASSSEIISIVNSGSGEATMVDSSLDEVTTNDAGEIVGSGLIIKVISGVSGKVDLGKRPLSRLG